MREPAKALRPKRSCEAAWRALGVGGGVGHGGPGGRGGGGGRGGMCAIAAVIDSASDAYFTRMIGTCLFVILGKRIQTRSTMDLYLQSLRSAGRTHRSILLGYTRQESQHWRAAAIQIIDATAISHVSKFHHQTLDTWSARNLLTEAARYRWPVEILMDTASPL